ncbi:MAG: hypothetical protein U9R74_07760 [Pseudomonadota bacterium]|nr:hypothetical protein [Pseudomonadota bacterium]
MAQLHFYVPDEVAKEIRRRAQQSRLTVSRYLAELVKRETLNEWPEDYFEHVTGQWKGEPLLREPEGEYEDRPGL